jgi:uncharacterized protein with GYD domain
MSSVSNLNSGLPEYGGYSARFGSQENYVNSYESLDAELTIETREGDVVTLSASMFSEMEAYEYNEYGAISSGNAGMQAAYHEREISLTSGEAFTFTVEGDLSEEELKDIEAIVKGIDEIIGEMAEGDMNDAIAKAMTMGTYDSVAMYEADISVAQSYEMFSETQTASYDRLGRMEGAELPEAEPEEKGVKLPNFMDQVAELLEEQEAERLARAQQPLSQLFDHHLAALEDMAEEDEELEAPEEMETAYATLETFANDVNQMITDYIRDLFQDTLDQIV